MFIGHFALGFAAKRVAPKPSLGTLLMAAQLIDLLWPVFVILGVESVAIDPGNTAVTPLDFTHYPWTHSLAGVLFWSVLFGGVYYAVRRAAKPALVLGGLVLSHWVLDLISHRPDLPLLPGDGIKVGLGLWQSIIGTVVIEGALFAVGVFLYARATRPRNRAGRLALVGLVTFLVIAYVASIFGPPPPSAEAVAYSGLAMWLLVAWGYWIDRNRMSVERPR